ncbi:hypothetical protein NC651_033639 [Populus alba x Populus x berolinensis]|nr:hypothetical protein NC651_033639 [Populus alba x Populus x berolinensis]
MSSATTARSLHLLTFISLLFSPSLVFYADHRVNGRFDSSNPICSVLFRFDSDLLVKKSSIKLLKYKTSEVKSHCSNTLMDIPGIT